MKTLWLPLVLFVGICLLVGWKIAIARKLSVLWAQLAAYRRGDYQTQLKIIEGFRTKGSAPPYYFFLHGDACFELGRLEEAEQAIRRSASMETDPVQRMLCRDQLGRVLMEQGRWDEAAACFRDCIAEAPNRGGGHRAMAELLLRRGQQNEAALDAARRAVVADRAEKVARGKLAKFSKELRALHLSQSLALFAWALAKHQADPDEVESTLNEAFALCGEATKPILAELHFCAGQAYAALGNKAESRRHFECAINIDPIGIYGRLSRSVAAAINPAA
jgi:tetratricopeptide (TPR) repeat protein